MSSAAPSSSVLDVPPVPVVSAPPSAADPVIRIVASQNGIRILSQEPRALSSLCGGGPPTTATTNTSPPSLISGSRVGVDLNCPLCAYSSQDRQEFIKHKRTHVGEKQFSCPECTAKFTRNYYLKRHLIQKHNNFSVTSARFRDVQVPRYCSVSGCNFVTRNSILLTVHKKSHKLARPYYCRECHIQYAHRRSIVHHIVRKHACDMSLFGQMEEPLGNQNGAVSAQQPTSSGAQAAGDLRKSPRMATRATSSSSYSDGAGSVGSERKSVINQNNRDLLMSVGDSENAKDGEHGNEYLCDHCEYVGPSFKALYAHRRRHKEREMAEPCIYCYKKFASSDKLRSHMKQQHILKQHGPGKTKARQRPLYTCTKCPYAARTKRMLRGHVCRRPRPPEGASTGAKVSRAPPPTLASFSCKLCSFVTNIEASLGIHMDQCHGGTNMVNLSKTVSPPRIYSGLSPSREPTLFERQPLHCLEQQNSTSHQNLLKSPASGANNRQPDPGPKFAFARESPILEKSPPSGPQVLAPVSFSDLGAETPNTPCFPCVVTMATPGSPADVSVPSISCGVAPAPVSVVRPIAPQMSCATSALPEISVSSSDLLQAATPGGSASLDSIWATFDAPITAPNFADFANLMGGASSSSGPNLAAPAPLPESGFEDVTENLLRSNMALLAVVRRKNRELGEIRGAVRRLLERTIPGGWPPVSTHEDHLQSGGIDPELMSIIHDIFRNRS